jgi:hypothetical protein
MKLSIYGILLFIVFATLANAKEVTVFYDDFSDGDYTSNPAWHKDYGNLYVQNGTLNSDGAIVDGSGRYSTTLHYNSNISTIETLIFSFNALIKSVGSPQIGRGVHLSYLNSNIGVEYLFSVANGYTNGAPYNHQSVTFIHLGGEGAKEYVTTQYVPSYDTWYKVKAIRKNGIWTLYVNNQIIGSSQDQLNINSIGVIFLDTVGSVSIDDINITVEVPDDVIPPEPEIEVDPLLKKFAPVLYMHPNEPYLPKEIASVMDYSDLKQSNGDIAKSHPLGLLDLSSISSSRSYYMDMINAKPKEEYGFPEASDFDSYNSSIYGRIVEDENHYKHLQYFIFYPFQRWYNTKHEGDWEMVQVTLNPSDKIESVTYFFNIFTMPYYNKELLDFVDYTHPVVYVAKGSHHTYPDDKLIVLPEDFIFLNNLLGKIKALDNVKSGGVVVKPENIEIENEEVLNYNLIQIDDLTSWIDYQGRWGEETGFELNNGPRGPKHSARFFQKWNKPEEFSYAPDVPFMSAFLYSPLDIVVFGSNGEKITNLSEKMQFYTGEDSEPEAILVSGDRNYTLTLSAKEDGQFTLEVYYYDNETETGIMVRYENITSKRTTKASLDVSLNSHYVLYLDDKDNTSIRYYLPSSMLTYNNYSYVLPDTDGDGVNDYIDNCLNAPNKYQADFNKNGLGDACDSPRYYKKMALSALNNLAKATKKENLTFNLVRRNIEESLEQENWKNDFEPIKIEVFVREFTAALLLKDQKNISNLLAKADSVIVEKQLSMVNVTGNRHETIRKLDSAKKLFNEGNKEMKSGENAKAILLFMGAWQQLNHKP